MTYVPLVYRTSGGDEMVVDTSGNLAIHESGSLSLAAGALVYTSLTTGANLFTTDGYLGDVRIHWEKTSGSSGAITNYGVTWMAPDASSGNKHYTIAPAPGRFKYVICTYSTSTSATCIQTTGTWDGTNNLAVFSTGSANVQSFMAIGMTTALWQIFPLSTDITMSATGT